MICKKKSCAIKSSRKYREIYFCLRLPQHKTYSQKKNVYRIECEGGGEPEENIEPAAKRRKVIGELNKPENVSPTYFRGIYFPFYPPEPPDSVHIKSWSIQQAPLILYDVYHSLRHHFIQKRPEKCPRPSLWIAGHLSLFLLSGPRPAFYSATQ